MPYTKEMLSIGFVVSTLLVRPFIALASVLPLNVDSGIHSLGSVIPCWDDPVFDRSLRNKGKIMAKKKQKNKKTQNQNQQQKAILTLVLLLQNYFGPDVSQ